jgi:hypothetical protein
LRIFGVPTFFIRSRHGADDDVLHKATLLQGSWHNHRDERELLRYHISRKFLFLKIRREWHYSLQYARGIYLDYFSAKHELFLSVSLCLLGCYSVVCRILERGRVRGDAALRGCAHILCNSLDDHRTFVNGDKNHL